MLRDFEASTLGSVDVNLTIKQILRGVPPRMTGLEGFYKLHQCPIVCSATVCCISLFLPLFFLLLNLRSLDL